ncbi:hypothetical protein [Streptomyces sp. AA1529]|nr:hypothetical protein [Streptomyces sp. AA1529]
MDQNCEGVQPAGDQDTDHLGIRGHRLDGPGKRAGQRARLRLREPG